MFKVPGCNDITSSQDRCRDMLAVVKALFLQDTKINEFLCQLHRILIRVEQMVLDLFQIAKEDIQLFLDAPADLIQHDIRDVHFIASLSE